MTALMEKLGQPVHDGILDESCGHKDEPAGWITIDNAKFEFAEECFDTVAITHGI